MLRCGKSIRLTRKEAERFELITGFPVKNVRTLGDLKRYVARCKAYYRDDSEDWLILERLIDRHVSRCIAAA